MKRIKRFLKEEEGATMIEYGLIAALVSVAAVAILFTVGQSLTTVFTTVNTNLPKAS